MLLARNAWLRYGGAFLLLGILILVAHEHGTWSRVNLPWPSRLSVSGSTTEVTEEHDSTILKGIDTGKGSKIIVIGKIQQDDTTWVQKELPE